MFAEVSGARLFYEERGSGPAILLLHGFTLDHRMWRRQLDALSDRFRVIAYDARGFGRSDAPTGPYSHYEDAAALCAQLGVERVVAVGHSIGAHQTLELALAHPDLVIGWGAVCASGLAGVAFPPDVMAVFKAIREAPTIDEKKRVWRTVGWFFSERELPELDAILADYSAWHWTHDNPSRGLEPAAATRLGELAIPVTVMHGERDLPYNTEVAQVLARGIRGAKLVSIPHAGHMAPMDAPEPVTAAIAELTERANRANVTR